MTAGKHAVSLADRAKVWKWQVAHRTVLGEALLQSGHDDLSHAAFAEAEAIRAQNDPKFPTLASVEGFRYCELLLRVLEVAAIAVQLGTRSEELSFSESSTYDSVISRAKAAAQYDAHEGRLLAKALDHLVLGRAQLYRAIISHKSMDGATQRLEDAVLGLRDAGHDWLLPLGLVSRAWLRSFNDPTRCNADLREAWVVAERSGMRLYMADILLLRALALHDKKALRQARSVIRSCGYGRREVELAHIATASRAW